MRFSYINKLSSSLFLLDLWLSSSFNQYGQQGLETHAVFQVQGPHGLPWFAFGTLFCCPSPS